MIPLIPGTKQAAATGRGGSQLMASEIMGWRDWLGEVDPGYATKLHQERWTSTGGRSLVGPVDKHTQTLPLWHSAQASEQARDVIGA